MKICDQHTRFSFRLSKDWRRRGAGLSNQAFISIVVYLFSCQINSLETCYVSPRVAFEFLSLFLSEVRRPDSPRPNHLVKFLISHRRVVRQGPQDIAAWLPAVLLGRYATVEVVRP